MIKKCTKRYSLFQYRTTSNSIFVLLITVVITSSAFLPLSLTTVSAFTIPGTQLCSTFLTNNSKNTRCVGGDGGATNRMKMSFENEINLQTPTKYIRVQPRNVRGNRRIFELQTAVGTLTKTFPNGEICNVDLHAMLHFGDYDYFHFYNNQQAFGNKYEKVFYELILSQDMLLSQPDGTRILKSTGDYRYPNPIEPPPSDEAIANSYNLNCQINIVNYTQPDWIHCDITKEKLDDLRSTEKKLSTVTNPVQEYISALFRASTPSSSAASSSSSSSPNASRLFSNLFLPGNSLVIVLRLLSWIFSPSPEIVILLLDWSSLIDPKPTGMISTIFIPAIESLVSGNVMEAKRLIFAQLLASSQTAGGTDLIVVRRRNGIALKILIDSIEKKVVENETTTRTTTLGSTNNNALLYGAMHCQDLQSRLEKMGYTLSKIEWRNAWSTSVSSFGTPTTATTTTGENNSSSKRLTEEKMGENSNTNTTISVGLVFVLLYLLVGALDWIATIQSVLNLFGEGLLSDSVAVAIFYLIRHVSLYVGLAKFVVEWDGEANVFSGGTSR